MALSEIGIGAATATFGGTSLGVSAGGVTVNYVYELATFKADQYSSPIRSDIVSENITVVFPVAEWNYDVLALLLPQGTATTDGTKEKLEFGGGTFTYSTDMKELILDPVDDSSDNLKVTVHLALPHLAGEIGYTADGYRILNFEFMGHYDSTEDSGKNLFVFGDTTAT